MTNEPAPKGYPYRLKFTQYEIAVKYQAVSCDPSSGTPLKIKVTPTITPKTAFDPKRFYVVDVRALGGPLKASEASLEWYADRTLKSINASVDDQSGQVIANVLTGVGKIASVALGAAGGGDVCSVGVASKIKPVDDAKAAVEAAEKVVAAQTLVVAQWAAKSAEMGAAVDRETRGHLSAEIGRLRAHQVDLANKKTALEKALKDVTYERKIIWPLNGDERASEKPYPLPDDIIQKWKLDSDDAKNVDLYLELRPKEEIPMPSADLPERAQRRDGYKSPPGQVVTQKVPWGGLPYREPAWATLYICQKTACAKENPDALEAADALVLQMGPMLLLPFEGQPFAAGKASASFTEAGVLQTAGFSQTRSSGAGASEAFKSAAEQIAPILKAEREEDLKKLEAETAQLKAQKAFADAKAALDPVADADKLKEIKAMETETALLAAQRNMMNAQAALGPIPDADRLAEIKTLETQIALLKAQATLLASQKALEVAQQEATP